MAGRILHFAVGILFCGLISTVPIRVKADNDTPKVEAPAAGIDLRQKYPTQLKTGDDNPERARRWKFTGADVFRVSQFHLKAGKSVRIDVGQADLGIGHCSDGAVWAVLIPRKEGELTSALTNQAERIDHIWLRFHPGTITTLFPPDTVLADGNTNLVSQMRCIANHKMTSSWHAGGRAMIPEPKDMTVDVDIKDGLRRFFSVDTEAGTAEYYHAFEKRGVRPPPALTSDAAQAAFDQLWEAFDRTYAMFVLRPEVDWAKLRDEFRPKALACQSTLEFAEVCAEMLKPLRDLHVWLTVAGDHVPVFNRPRAANSNPSAHEAILGNLQREGREVEWAVTDDQIGYIAIYGWSDSDTPKQCQLALEKMRATRGLIVDVRLNGGGSEDLAMEFAARFLEKDFVYAYSQFRNGSSHTNLTEKFARTIAPQGPWRYDRPVVLLIGQKCMSSNESFVGMMTGEPEVTTMGDHTCGSSGNPKIIHLPLEMTVSVPQWIDYRPDGTTLDEHGFQPQIPFIPTSGAFEGNRDDLLTAALARLRPAPLPDKPIAGPAFLPEEEAEAQDESRPKVIAVFPADGAKSVAPATEMRVRFDRPMDPLALKLDWKSGGFLDCEFPKYDAKLHEFTFAVHLASSANHEIVLNNPTGFGGTIGKRRADFPRDGFQSLDHRLARFFTWKFQTSSSASPTNGQPPKVVNISPAPGSTVPYRTFLEVQFDQPMKPPTEVLPYLTGEHDLKGAALICQIQYDAASHTFRLPLILYPKAHTAFTLAGFYSAAGLAAEPIQVDYQVSGEALSRKDRESIEADERNPRLLAALETMKQQRAKMTSIAEQVQTLSMSDFKAGLFTRLSAQSASFKWQSPNRFYADITDKMLMCRAFVIGCDGQNWWWHNESARWTNFSVCPTNEMQQLNISLCDPFELTQKSSSQSATDLALNDVGTVNLGRYKCELIEGWDVESIPEMTTIGRLNRWAIDTQTGRPLEIRNYSDNSQMRTRFLYDEINQSMPAEAFAIPKLDGLSPSPAEALDKDYTKRFIDLRDGSDGTMSLRWGKEGPKGRSSSGLN